MTSRVRHCYLALVSVIAACGAQHEGAMSGPAAGSGSPPSPAADGGGAPDPSTSSVGGAGAATDPGPPRVRFIGRFDTSDSAGPWCAWPGCRIVAKFDGTRVAVQLDERAESWMRGGPSEWDVAIDGQPLPKLVLEPGAQTYELARDLPRGVHTVEIYKRSEAQNGYTQFLGYDFGGGELLPPPPAATRRIEIVGDSQPAGFGVDSQGLGPNCPGPSWAARYQDFHESFGAHLGEIFGADVTGSVYSGKGIVRNIDPSDPETMPVIYPRANPLFASPSFDLASLVPDAMIVMIGANDFDVAVPDDGPLAPEVFTAAYRAFVTTLRATYPRAQTWLVTSPSVTDDEPPGRLSRTNITNAIHSVVEQMGDPGLHEAAPPLATPDELLGCNGHGTPAYHQRLAVQLAAIMRPELGW